jgi:hypothetical protein
MTRSPARGAFALAASLVIAAALLFAATAPAAKPKKNARFAGTTNATPVEGFHAPVKFTVSPDGRSLYNFTFGSFGCFGAGGFAPNKNPYTGHSLIDAGRLKVGSNGKFEDNAISAYTVQGQTTTTKITISGAFSSPKKVSGKITFSQTVVGGGVNSRCGPVTPRFSATTK